MRSPEETDVATLLHKAQCTWANGTTAPPPARDVPYDHMCDVVMTNEVAPSFRPESTLDVQEILDTLEHMGRQVRSLSASRDRLAVALTSQHRTRVRATPPPALPRRHHHMDWDD